jgi:hypothetical protein
MKYYSVWNRDAIRWTNHYYNGAQQDVYRPFNLTKEDADEWLLRIQTSYGNSVSYEVREVPDVCYQDCCKGR